MNSSTNKIIFFLRNCLNFNFKLLPPHRAPIAIFDSLNSSDLIDFLTEYKVTYVNPICSEINFFILLKSIFGGKSYYDSFLAYLKPNIFITLIDNSKAFLSVKTQPGCKKITIQNGYRSALNGDLFAWLEQQSDLFLDHAFVFNDYVGSYLVKNIDGVSYSSIGSFKSNNEKIKIIETKKGILYISTFREYYLSQGNEEYEKGISVKNYLRSELEFLTFLGSYAEENMIDVTVLGRGDKEIEKNFYETFFQEVNYKFISNFKGRDTYSVMDSYEYIVSIDSSMGYEAMSRKANVAIFPGIRGDVYPFNTRNFCFPAENILSTGPFWTDECSIIAWRKVLDNMTKKSLFFDANTKLLISKCLPRDEGNLKLKKFLKKNLNSYD